MKKFFQGLWGLIKEKGKIATIVGFLFTLPYNGKFMYDFFTGGTDYSNDQLTFLVIVNVIGIAWFILPSKITMKGGKFKFIVED